jgi:hypothetical protein
MAKNLLTSPQPSPVKERAHGEAIPARRGRIRNLCGKTTGDLNLNDREIALLNHAISQPHLT